MLYPSVEPFSTLSMPVSHGHVLHVEERGDEQGVPALVLHGGPGSGCGPLLARYFDPKRYRVITVDQRGAGRSTPRGGVEANSTADLLGDLRRLRERLGVSRWLVVGGSWGATLAIAHAADDPAAVSGLLLRSLFLARPLDIERFFGPPESGGPLEAWQRFTALAGGRSGRAMVDHLGDVFARGDAGLQSSLAQAWSRWETAMSASPGRGGAMGPFESRSGAGAGGLVDARGSPGAGSRTAPRFDPPADALVDRYRVQSHYLRHACWLVDRDLLDLCARVPPVPVRLLHGSDDRVCPLAGAERAAARLPRARLQRVDGCGHDPTHPGMVDAMVTALDRHALHGTLHDAEST